MVVAPVFCRLNPALFFHRYPLTGILLTYPERGYFSPSLLAFIVHGVLLYRICQELEANLRERALIFAQEPKATVRKIRCFDYY
jgi:hypothetical protein